MQTYLVLLRAVNVGGTGKLPMAELRSMAEAEGFENVRSYIQSGNLIFTSSDTSNAVKVALERRLENYAGKSVGVIMRTVRDMQDVLANNPFPHAAPNKVGVLFLNDAPKLTDITNAKGRSDEEILLGRKEIFIHFPSGMGVSRLRMTAMSEGTMRNMNTVTQLVKLAT